MVAFGWLFSTVYFQMLPQIAWMRRCRVTLAAFVWLFSTVSFQMLPQMACLRRCIVALVAFVWLFSTVYFQMCRIVTLVAFLSSTCLFHWNLNSCGFTKISLFTILIHFWHESSVLPSCKFRFQLRDGMALDWEDRNWKWNQSIFFFDILIHHFVLKMSPENRHGHHWQTMKCKSS